eukprot:11197138-Ditylum_brightwellii.AAC.1
MENGKPIQSHTKTSKHITRRDVIHVLDEDDDDKPMTVPELAKHDGKVYVVYKKSNNCCTHSQLIGIYPSPDMSNAAKHDVSSGSEKKYKTVDEMFESHKGSLLREI